MTKVITTLEKSLWQWTMTIALIQAGSQIRAEPSNCPRPDFPMPDGAIFSLLTTNEVIYVGGNFQAIGNREHPYLAALYVHNGEVLNWKPQVHGPVSAMAVSSNTLYVGIRTMNNQATNAVDAFEIGTAQRPSAWAGYIRTIAIETAFTRINAVATGHGRIYFGGEWTGRFIYALEPTTGAALAWNPDQFEPNGVDTIRVVGSTVYVGGASPSFSNRHEPTLLHWIGILHPLFCGIRPRMGVCGAWPRGAIFCSWGANSAGLAVRTATD